MIRATHLSRVLAGAALASALCMSAAAAAADPAADYYLKIKGVEGGSANPHKGEIEILSWSWGATQSSSGHTGGGMGAGKVAVHDPAAESGEAEITLKGDADAEARKRPGRVKYGDITLKRGTTAESTGGVSVAAGDVDGDGMADVVSPRDAASGLPTGKRQHKPMTITKELDKATPVLALARPLDSGSVTLVGRFGGCAVGTRYPELELGGKGGPTYRLRDAIVTSCAMSASSGGGGGGGGSSAPMESISFNYSKIEF